MELLNKEIIIKSELRPCYYYEQKALFHQWVVRELPHNVQLKEGKIGYIEKVTLALIEFDDGSMIYAPPQDIQFADSEHKFKQFAF